MATIATKPYPMRPVDGIEHYHGNQLVYWSWDHHLMFAAPFITCPSPSAPMIEFLESTIRPLIAPDPDAARLDWTQVEWVRDHEPITIDVSKSFSENGIGHKDLLRFRTPGMNTLCG